MTNPTPYEQLTSNVARKDFIRGKLEDNVKWATKGLVTIYKFQTESEKACGATHEDNGVGFSGVDSEILSSFAEQVNKKRNLSIKQIAILHRLMPKYAGQLVKIAKREQS